MTPRGAELKHLLRSRLGGFDVRTLDLKGRRHAAVTVPVTEEGHGAEFAGLPQHEQWSDAPALLLTRRAETLSSHAGQCQYRPAGIFGGIWRQRPELERGAARLHGQIAIPVGPPNESALPLGKSPNWSRMGDVLIRFVVAEVACEPRFAPSPASGLDFNPRFVSQFIPQERIRRDVTVVEPPRVLEHRSRPRGCGLSTAMSG